MRLSIGALASLFTGHANPWDLRLRGLLDAPDADVATLGRLFAGPTPGMPDFF